MFLNKGSFNGKQILGKKTVELVYMNQNSHIPDSPYGLAFGLVSEKDQALGGKGSARTLYWSGYFHTHFFVDPVDKLIGIIYLQTYDYTSYLIPNEFKALVFHSLIN